MPTKPDDDVLALIVSDAERLIRHYHPQVEKAIFEIGDAKARITVQVDFESLEDEAGPDVRVSATVKLPLVERPAIRLEWLSGQLKLPVEQAS